MIVCHIDECVAEFPVSGAHREYATACQGRDCLGGRSVQMVICVYSLVLAKEPEIECVWFDLLSW